MNLKPILVILMLIWCFTAIRGLVLYIQELREPDVSKMTCEQIFKLDYEVWSIPVRCFDLKALDFTYKNPN